VLCKYFSNGNTCISILAVIGLLYPKLDTLFGYGEKHQDWSSVMRCIATFVGINHASAVSFTLSTFTVHCIIGSLQIVYYFWASPTSYW